MGKRKESQEISIGPILVYVDVCELAELGCLTVPLPGASKHQTSPRVTNATSSELYYPGGAEGIAQPSPDAAQK